MVHLSLIKDFRKTLSYWDGDAILLISLYITDYASDSYEEEGLIPERLYIITSDLDRIYLSRNPDATPDTEADFIIRTWDLHWDENKPEFVSINWTFHVMGESSDGMGMCSVDHLDGSSDILVYGELASIRLAAYKGQSVITIPKEVVEIGAFTFKGFAHLEEVIISEGITIIDDYAFAGCTNLKRISLPESIKQIGIHAFEGCSSLAQIHFPDAVTEISRNTFSNCSSLQEIDIPKNTSIIEQEAFSGCVGLNKLWIPDSVTLIEEDAFRGCAALTEISIPFGLNITEAGLGKKVQIDIRSNDGVRTIPNGVNEISRYAFRNCSDLKGIHIPESVTLIGYLAFEGCIGLKELFIPDSVMVIGQDAFKGCSSLEKISIPIGLDVTETGLHPTTIIDIRTNDGIRNLPYGVTAIRAGAFRNCSELKGVHIPESVVRIGEEAFWGCTALKDVRLPDSVTEIGEEAFAACMNLTEINIPRSLTDIGKNAFGRHSYLWYMTMCNYPDLWIAMSGVEEDDEEYDDFFTAVNIVKAAQSEPDEEMRVLTIFKHCYLELHDSDSFDLYSFNKYIATNFRKEWYKNYCEELDEEKFDEEGDLNLFQFTNYRTKIGHTERQDRFVKFLQGYLRDKDGNIDQQVLSFLVDYCPYNLPLFYVRIAIGGDYDLFGFNDDCPISFDGQEGILARSDEFFEAIQEADCDEWDFNYALVLEEDYGADFAARYILASRSLFYDTVLLEADEIIGEFTKMIKGIASRCDNAELLSFAFDCIYNFEGINGMHDALELMSRLTKMWQDGKDMSKEIWYCLDWVFDEIYDWPNDPENQADAKEYVLRILESDFATVIKEFLAPHLKRVLEQERENWPEGVKAIEAFLNK